MKLRRICFDAAKCRRTPNIRSRTDPTSEARPDKSPRGACAPQHAFACKLFAFVLDGGSSRKRDGHSKAASSDPSDENIWGTLAVSEIVIDPALSGLDFEPAVRKPPNSRVVALAGIARGPVFSSSLATSPQPWPAPWADETVLCHQRQKPDSEYEMQVFAPRPIVRP